MLKHARVHYRPPRFDAILNIIRRLCKQLLTPNSGHLKGHQQWINVEEHLKGHQQWINVEEHLKGHQQWINV